MLTELIVKNSIRTFDQAFHRSILEKTAKNRNHTNFWLFYYSVTLKCKSCEWIDATWRYSQRFVSLIKKKSTDFFSTGSSWQFDLAFCAAGYSVHRGFHSQSNMFQPCISMQKRDQLKGWKQLQMKKSTIHEDLKKMSPTIFS